MEANRENTYEEKVVALIEVKVTPQRGVGYDKIAERIYQHKEVAQFVNEELATISSVVSTSTHFILKKYKENGEVLCENPEDERMLISL